MSATPTTFREAYALLQRHAQSLRAEQEPDIDNLTTIVRESLDAYQVCKARIDAVERALEASLGDAAVLGDERAAIDDRDEEATTGRLPGTGAGGSPTGHARPAPAMPTDPDDDIPF